MLFYVLTVQHLSYVEQSLQRKSVLKAAVPFEQMKYGFHDLIINFTLLIRFKLRLSPLAGNSYTGW